MKRITLDLRTFGTVSAAQIYLQFMLKFPDYYGKNLDALYDCLGDICYSTEITLLLSDLPWQNAIARVFEDAAQDNPELTVKIR